MIYETKAKAQVVADRTDPREVQRGYKGLAPGVITRIDDVDDECAIYDGDARGRIDQTRSGDATGGTDGDDNRRSKDARYSNQGLGGSATMSVTAVGFSLMSGLAIAQEVIPDATQAVEKYGVMGAFGLMLYFLLNGFAKRMDAIEQAIKEQTVVLIKLAEKK